MQEVLHAITTKTADLENRRRREASMKAEMEEHKAAMVRLNLRLIYLSNTMLGTHKSSCTICIDTVPLNMLLLFPALADSDEVHIIKGQEAP
jgi:hypothetical protein